VTTTAPQTDAVAHDSGSLQASPPGAGAPLVGVDSVALTYGRGHARVEALADISFELGLEEIVAFLGPSGCGKSTLLKLIGGLFPPNAGTIEIAGERVTEPHRRVGMMFQTPVLFEWLRVIDNVLLPVTIGGRASDTAREQALHYLEMAGIAEFGQNYPTQLSGGMQQRVAICRMLMTHAQIFLMDEPFGALDEMTRERLDFELRSLVERENRSGIFVTHSVIEAAFIADRIIVMSPRPGRIAGEVKVPLGKGRSKDLFESDELHEITRQARAILRGEDQ
jgi:NitT/TauT family transport system ATP-binding protein